MRDQLLAAQRHQAIAAAPCRIDLVGIAPAFEDKAEYYTQQNALSWRRDPTAASEIEAQLSSYGFDQHAINVEVHAQVRELFVQFEACSMRRKASGSYCFDKSETSAISAALRSGLNQRRNLMIGAGRKPTRQAIATIYLLDRYAR